MVKSMTLVEIEKLKDRIKELKYFEQQVTAYGIIPIKERIRLAELGAAVEQMPKLMKPELFTGGGAYYYDVTLAFTRRGKWQVHASQIRSDWNTVFADDPLTALTDAYSKQ